MPPGADARIATWHNCLRPPHHTRLHSKPELRCKRELDRLLRRQSQLVLERVARERCIESSYGTSKPAPWSEPGVTRERSFDDLLESRQLAALGVTDLLEEHVVHDLLAEHGERVRRARDFSSVPKAAQ